MKILFVVQKLPTDPIGNNHFRVEHHHSEGLTYDTCFINGVKRFIRATSSPSQKRKAGSTILVHCKPLRVFEVPRLKCADIPTVEILRYINLYKTWPTAANYRQWTNVSKFDHVRLAKRKEDTLVHRGYVTQYDADGVFCECQVFLTVKGKQRLQQLEQQSA